MAKKPLRKRLAFVLSPTRAYRRTLNGLRRLRQELYETFVELFYFLTRGVLVFFYDKTLPITSRLLSRKPRPPFVSVNDVRANRIRLQIKSSFASPFNVEQFEVEWSPLDQDTWSSTGYNNLEHRTVARLKPDTEYKFRVRAKNKLGESGWSQEVSARSKIDPKNGGGYTKDYVWEQTATDVSIMFEVPPGTKKADIQLTLKAEWIRVEVMHPDGTPRILLEGDLYGRVKSFENGSFWELVKEGRKLMLNLTLEKHSKSLAPKFDYWRAIIPGQHEIDTHKIENEEAGAGPQMLQPGQYDPVQMRNMGVRGF